jgi:hypothetical protein
MPISKSAWMDPKNVKNIINLLIESNLTSLDAPATLWRFDYNKEDEYYEDSDTKYESLLELYNNIDTIELRKIFFEIGFSHYDYEYKELKNKNALPGINLLTDQLKEHMDEFCIKHDIPPAIDVFGGIKFGLISPDSEDEQGEQLGVGIYCDGNVAQFMEDAGFLTQLNSNIGIYSLFEKISNMLNEEVTVQFRY